MNRRGFLGSLFWGVISLSLMPTMPLAAPWQRVVVQESPVAGFQYHDERLAARIVALRRSHDPWERVRFEVFLDG